MKAAGKKFSMKINFLISLSQHPQPYQLESPGLESHSLWFGCLSPSAHPRLKGALLLPLLPGGGAFLTPLPSEKEFHSLWIWTKPCCSAFLPRALPIGVGDIPVAATFPVPEGVWGCACIPAPCEHSPAASAALHGSLQRLLARSGSPTALAQLKCSRKHLVAVLLSARGAPSRDTTSGHPDHRACVQPSFSFSPWEAEKSEF